MPYVEYTCNIESEEEKISQLEKEQKAISENAVVVTASAPPQSRAVARKSTSKKQPVVETTTYTPTTETKPSHSIVVSAMHEPITILL